MTLASPDAAHVPAATPVASRWPLGPLLLLYVAFWTLVPTLTFRTVPLDVAENILWGREWPAGTYKHPPLQAWLTEIAHLALGPMGIYLLSAGCLAATALIVARLGRELVGRDAGRLAALLLLATCTRPFRFPSSTPTSCRCRSGPLRRSRCTGP
ncbi:glycosyltransferase family 39 protein [Methylobrevis pamukkalensis]|uniref:Glycosyltransferase RgtA/B/C/D-like domain-containing protein n=1 Tax=Methylobrevis pamukkalensis TaxID=1439726 RepID=A0A1E3H4P0_9HYPH|nr:glycosyltransferase family 39 protein [Methylobrevis pamukkalensis]ODN70481.1 hypothetical protein A6302_02223 [Methylobrevis pamukkalensis]